MSEKTNITVHDRKLAHWLRSNPIADPYQTTTPVLGIECVMTSGFLRWPLVPEQPSPDTHGQLTRDT